MKYTLTARELSNFFGQLGMLIHSGNRRFGDSSG